MLQNDKRWKNKPVLKVRNQLLYCKGIRMRYKWLIELKTEVKKSGNGTDRLFFILALWELLSKRFVEFLFSF